MKSFHKNSLVFFVGILTSNQMAPTSLFSFPLGIQNKIQWTLVWNNSIKKNSLKMIFFFHPGPFWVKIVVRLYQKVIGHDSHFFSQLEIIQLKSTWSKSRPPLMLYLETVKPESHYFWILCGGVTNYFPMKASTLQNENAFTSMTLVVEY